MLLSLSLSLFSLSLLSLFSLYFSLSSLFLSLSLSLMRSINAQKYKCVWGHTVDIGNLPLSSWLNESPVFKLLEFQASHCTLPSTYKGSEGSNRGPLVCSEVL